MKLLLDNNLSAGLLNDLGGTFPGSEHVRRVGLTSSGDLEVWRYAIANGFAILSKDRDFADMAILEGPPAKCFWLTVGNCSIKDVLEVLLKHHANIAEFAEDPEAALVIIPPNLRFR